MSYVIVQKRPYGTLQISDAAIDVFHTDELTVTPAVGPQIILGAGRWIEAIQFDERGNPEVAFQSEVTQ